MKTDKEHIEQEIDRYVHGDLSEKEIEALWEALIQEQQYNDYLHTAANLKAIKRDEAPKTANIFNRWVYAGAAALLLLLAVFAVIYFTKTEPKTSVEPIAAIELPFQRSINTGAEITDHDKIIRKAIILYYDNEFEKAVNLLQNELKKAEEPDWIARLNITLGILYYNDDMFEAAKNYFAEAVSLKDKIDPLKLEKAYWYLGNAYFQMWKLDKAEVAMRKALELDGAYSRVVKMYLNAMEAAGHG